MKSLILSAAAAALIFAAPAALADNDHHQHHGGGGQHAQNRGNSGGQHQNRSFNANHSVAHANRTVERTNRVRANRVQERHVRENRASTNRSFRTETRRTHERNTTRANNMTRHVNATNRENRNSFRNNNRNNSRVVLRANFRRHNVTASHHYRYRGGAYHRPHGYSYRRWSYGERLPSLYYARDYWIDDYSDYGLGYPPEGCVWVRYGDDAILIDEDTGEILEVVYGQFY